jgi:ribosome-associated translation inhibitor RaiA
VDSWVERQILALGQTRRIDEANVRLVCQWQTSPAYEVSVHLVTPGPDVFAAARDHTLRAAITKAVTELREQIDHRAAKRLRRMKRNLKVQRVR